MDLQQRRPLLAIALDNAREGCGRELLGAMVGLHQAAHADPSVRDFYRAIAADEVRHAALGLRIHDWVLSRLSETDRARVIESWRAALREHAGVSEYDPFLGIPSATRRTRMARLVHDALTNAA